MTWADDSKPTTERAQQVAKRYRGAIFLLAAGPLSVLLGREMWEVSPSNIYWDVGSLLLAFRSKDAGSERKHRMTQRQCGQINKDSANYGSLLHDSNTCCRLGLEWI